MFLVNLVSTRFLYIYGAHCITTSQRILYQSKHYSHTHSCTRESHQHTISWYVIVFYVTAMNLMHSLMVC